MYNYNNIINTMNDRNGAGLVSTAYANVLYRINKTKMK